MPNGRVLYDSFVVRLERNVSMEEELRSSVEILNFYILILADPRVPRKSEYRSYNERDYRPGEILLNAIKGPIFKRIHARTRDLARIQDL